MTDPAAGAGAAAKAGAEEAFDIVVETLVPIGAALGGFAFGARLIGGQTSIANAVWAAQGSSGSGTTANRVGGLVMAVILGSAGYSLWGLRHKGGIFMKLLGGLAGGFLLGTAAADALFGAILGNQPSGPGAIDDLFNMTQNIVTGA